MDHSLWSLLNQILVLLGYSPEDALQFINAADAKKPPPDYEKIWRSRTNMANTVQNFLKTNDDFLC